MTVSTSVPALTFTSTGVSAPTEAEILTGVQADINTAFGGNLNQNLNTPQGQIASSQTAIIGDVNDNFLYFVNQVDPANASGAFQDAIGRIYFMNRIAAASTVVQCDCIGVTGTVIPAGTQAQDTSGNTYISLASATIGNSGTVSVEFQNITTGPIACAANTLIVISQQIIGWDAINNSSSGILGRNVETQQDFEYRRQQSVAINAKGTNAAIAAKVWAVNGVLDCYVTDNPSNIAVTKGITNYSLLPHSVYVAVIGGTSADIAAAIQKSKDGGCDMNGNTSYVISDTSYSYPYPSNTYKYNIPTSTPIYFSVNLVNNSNLPSDIITQVKTAIINAFNGADGGTRARIGSEIFASRYYAGIASLSQYVAILSLFVGSSLSPSTTTVTMGIDQAPTIDASNIQVTLV